MRAALDADTGTVTVVALPLTDTDAAISRLIVVEAIATAIALGVLALVAWWVVRLGVRPIKRMADAAAEIADGNLSERVPEGDPRTEAGELGVALNRMLEQIEAAFAERSNTEARLRQFVADASHELRTPVTTIRGYAELYREGALDDRADLDDAMRRAEQEAVRMGALVEDMLQLARLDQHRPPRDEVVDMALLATDTAADARAVDTSRVITVVGAERLTVSGDSDRLRQVLANLVRNALVHTPPGTPIELRMWRDVDTVVVDVVDHGPGMTPDDAAHVFERFYRAGLVALPAPGWQRARVVDRGRHRAGARWGDRGPAYRWRWRHDPRPPPGEQGCFISYGCDCADARPQHSASPGTDRPLTDRGPPSKPISR